MRLLFIGNVGYRFNSFVLSSSMAAKELNIEFHVAGNWTGYDNLEDKKADEKKYGVKIHQIDFVRTPYHPQNIKAYNQVVRLIREEKIDIIHCNTPIGGVVGRLAAKKCKVKKVIYQAHGFHFYTGAPFLNWLLYYPIEKLLAHFTDALITINQEDFERAKSFKLRNNGNVYYVPGVGVDVPACQNREKIREEKRKEMGIPQDAIVIISVGELNRNKNNAVIIQAVKEIEYTHYILCGEGPLLKDLKDIASTIKDRIHFLGYRTDINDLLAASDIFVMPSLREGLSRSLMEAMSLELPCVVSDIRGNRDLVLQEDCLCDARSAESFEIALRRLCHDKELRDSIAKKNAVRVKEFTLEKVENAIVKIYNIFIE